MTLLYPWEQNDIYVIEFCTRQLQSLSVSLTDAYRIKINVTQMKTKFKKKFDACLRDISASVHTWFESSHVLA